MKLCPQLGEIRRAGEIGYKGIGKYICHACANCGKKRWVKLEKGQPVNLRCQSCGCILRGWVYNKHPNWNGGKYKTVDGYMKIKLQPNDFFYPMVSRNGYVPEHRLVMAKLLNRCLLPWEVIHHRNGIKNDNRIENLELLPHHRHHLVDTKAKAYIRQLERRIRHLEKRLGEQIVEVTELKNKLSGSIK